MNQAEKIIAQHFNKSDGKLFIQGCDCTDLADSFGTPLFIYDASVIRGQIRKLKEALPDGFGIAYSVKANSNAAILAIFLQENCPLEIASIGEYQRARNAGCNPKNILFAGPGKTPTELSEVLSQGIGEIHAESFLELERIQQISSELNLTAKVAVRVNPTSEAQGGALRMGGQPAAFGIDEEQLPEALSFIKAHSELEFRGIHLFSGTQILDHQILADQYQKGIEIALKASEFISEPIHTLDFGGGLGIPYFEQENPLDLQALKQSLNNVFENVRANPALADTQFLVEPGRFLVGESGIYVTRINDLKASRGKQFAIMDGGMHHHLAASGNLGQVIKRNYPFLVLNKLNAEPLDTVELVGPLCTPLDTLGRNATLPPLEVGDLIGIFQSGAYARAASPLGFLSHPVPPEILIDGGKAKQISERAHYVY